MSYLAPQLIRYEIFWVIIVSIGEGGGLKLEFVCLGVFIVHQQSKKTIKPKEKKEMHFEMRLQWNRQGHFVKGCPTESSTCETLFDFLSLGCIVKVSQEQTHIIS